MGTCLRSSPLLPLCYFSWPWSRETVMLKGCPHFHVTFPGWLGTPEHPEMPHILSTPSYSDLQPGATRPRETAWLPEGPAWLRDYQNGFWKTTTFRNSRVQNVSRFKTPFTSGTLQPQKTLGPGELRCLMGRWAKRCKIQRGPSYHVPGPKNHILPHDGHLF